MKKIGKILLLLCCSMMIFTGCGERTNSSEDTDTSSETNSGEEIGSITEEEQENLREVVFLNRAIDPQSEDTVSISRNILKSFYEKEADPDTLYAFSIDVDHYYKNQSFYPEDYPVREENETQKDYMKRCSEYRRKVVGLLLQEEGFLIIGDLFQTQFVVAGTMENFVRVFEEKENLEDWYLIAESTERPDMEDILNEAGWNSDMFDEFPRQEWFEENMDILKSLLGTDANQVSLNVSIISLEEMTEPESLPELDISGEYVVEMKRVVFINRLRMPSYTDNIPTTNYFGGAYEFRNSQELLAFNVGKHFFEGSSKAEAIAVTEKMRELGLMVLADYPYSYNNYNKDEKNTQTNIKTGYCVVVGTYEQLAALFANTQAIDGRLYHLRFAVRPDIMDYIRKYSTEHIEGNCDCLSNKCNPYNWYDYNKNEIVEELGEESYITMIVPVIMPEETTENK